ncbi:hypothetical protein [Methylotuvimicrobium buryatense]|nr:hypothetical protein [Methylotuvimicrobium buryatense]
MRAVQQLYAGLPRVFGQSRHEVLFRDIECEGLFGRRLGMERGGKYERAR